jgi:hypothetical protein
MRGQCVILNERCEDRATSLILYYLKAVVHATLNHFSSCSVVRNGRCVVNECCEDSFNVNELVINGNAFVGGIVQK